MSQCEYIVSNGIVNDVVYNNSMYNTRYSFVMIIVLKLA